MLTDRVLTRTIKKVRGFLRGNKGIKITEYPVGCPDHNAVEAYWKDGKQKQRIPRSEDTERREAQIISEYYRTARFKHDILKYIMRKMGSELSNFGS